MSSESFKTVSLRPGAILMTEEVRICKMISALIHTAPQQNGYIVGTGLYGSTVAIQGSHSQYDNQLYELGISCRRISDKLAELG
jgi:hypothetical protein